MKTKRTKKLVSLLLCTALLLGLCVVSSASVQWSKICDITGVAELSDSGTYITVAATLESYDTEDLSIEVEVSAPGVVTHTYTVSDTGTYLSLGKKIPVVFDKLYTLVFTYDAGGESVTREIYVAT